MADNMSTKLNYSKIVGAILGAAYGDALGWPNERPGKSMMVKQSQDCPKKLKKWSRQSGGRSFPHKEIIEAGEYSDDTQLILCLARSLLKGNEWWKFYTQAELPFWSTYERGGGGAVKRAVNSWIGDKKPWNPDRDSKDVKRYFDAGGNGVAMRVLPHILHLNNKDFSKVAHSIFLDGIATHGHPRALLGALVYGFALWASLRRTTDLNYGELLEEMMANEAQWSVLPLHDQIDAEWMPQAEKHHKGYLEIWTSTKNEILEYLGISCSEISKGALSIDNDVLKQLQCFNRKISGAGTVAAISSAYLASRYAADPINGVVKAAFAIGSDTDTLASMAGGLLGCINGSDWLSSIKSGIQDSTYLEKMALRLSNSQSNELPLHEPELPLHEPMRRKKFKRSALKKWEDKVISSSDSTKIFLPDGQEATVRCTQDQIGKNGKYKVEFRKILTLEGQTFYINKISKGNFGSRLSVSNVPAEEGHYRQGQKYEQGGGLDLCPKFPVASIKKSALFYQESLGLTIKKQSEDMVIFHQGLVLVPEAYTKDLGIEGIRNFIYVKVTDIQNKYNLLSRRKRKIVTGIADIESSGTSKSRFFRCLDPDDNVVEVFERKIRS